MRFTLQTQTNGAYDNELRCCRGVVLLFSTFDYCIIDHIISFSMHAK